MTELTCFGGALCYLFQLLLLFRSHSSPFFRSTSFNTLALRWLLAMLTLSPGSSCDVCAEEYSPHSMPHCIPCGEYFFPCLKKKKKRARQTMRKFSLTRLPLAS